MVEIRKKWLRDLINWEQQEYNYIF
jgi:hypothetical protein